jgi:hypothetical protein
MNAVAGGGGHEPEARQLFTALIPDLKRLGMIVRVLAGGLT